MAFEGQQATLSNFEFQTCNLQTGVNGENMSFGPSPFALNPERDDTSHLPRSHNTQEEHLEVNYSQTSYKNRKPSENAEYEAEADLQGLVSNILDEAESCDSFFNRSWPTHNPIWSPKIMNEEPLEPFHPEDKSATNQPLSSNQGFNIPLPLSVDQNVNELRQQCSGLAGCQKWPFDSPYGPKHAFYTQKLPPGLPLPSRVSSHPVQMQQSKTSNMLPKNDTGLDHPFKGYPEFGNVGPQNNASSSFMDTLCQSYMQNEASPFAEEQCEEVNQLVNSFQSFMPGDHNSVLHSEDKLAEQWNITSPAMPTHSPFGMQMPNQLEAAQREMTRERKQAFKLNSFQNLHDLSFQHTDHLQSPFHCLNKTMLQRHDVNVAINQHTRHNVRQGQFQHKIQSWMETENNRIQMPIFIPEGGFGRQQCNSQMLEEVRQSFSQNAQNIQPHSFDKKHMISAGSGHHPLWYSATEHERHSSLSMNSNFRSKVVSANSPAACDAAFCDTRSHKAESTSDVLSAVKRTSASMTQEGHVMPLPFYLDQCEEQCKCLEKEIKQTEIILKAFSGKGTRPMNSIYLLKSPPNPTRVEHLIANHMREQTKVESLFQHMESLSGFPLHLNIHKVLKMHRMAVCVVQARCTEDGSNMAMQQHGIPSNDQRDNLLIVMALKELAETTRRLRTALWCALQILLPKPTKTQEHGVLEEAAHTGTCLSPQQGYSFCL